MRRIVIVLGLAIVLIGCGDPPTPERQATKAAQRAEARATAAVIQAEERPSDIKNTEIAVLLERVPVTLNV